MKINQQFANKKNEEWVAVYSLKRNPMLSLKTLKKGLEINPNPLL